MFLKDGWLVAEQGVIAIRDTGGGFQIELFCSGSRIDLLPSGEIVLTPKPGQPVRIEGNVNIGGSLNVTGPVTALSFTP